MSNLFDFFGKRNRIAPGARVEGKFGPLIPNPNVVPGKKSRRIRSQTTGVVVESVDRKLWKVKRDQDGEFINVRPCMMKIIDNAVGLPVDEVALEVRY